MCCFLFVLGLWHDLAGSWDMLDLLWLLDLDQKRNSCGTWSPNLKKNHDVSWTKLETKLYKHDFILFRNQTLKRTSIFSSSSRQSKPGAKRCRPSVGFDHRYVPTHSELWIVPRTPKEEAEGWREGGKIHTCKETKRLNELEVRILPVTSFTYLDIHICMDLNIVHPKNLLPPELVNEGV